MTKIIAEHKNVIFQFEEDTTQNRFINKTSSGVYVSAFDVNQSGVARWAKVTHVGDKVTEVSPGEYILIEPGRWTSGFYVDGVRFWKTDVDQIMATSDQPYSTY